MTELSTQEKIIKAVIELFRDHGYKGATTRAIAEKAGVNEVTIFRHFGNKKRLMEAAIQSLSYHSMLKKMISEKMVWDLEQDLTNIAQGYLKEMEKMQDLILIGLREAEMFPELNEYIVEIPTNLKKSMVEYFTEMHKKGKLVHTDIEFQAMNFIWLNFGYFLSKSRFGDQVIPGTNVDFIQHSVRLFARGLTP